MIDSSTTFSGALQLIQGEFKAFPGQRVICLIFSRKFLENLQWLSDAQTNSTDSCQYREHGSSPPLQTVLTQKILSTQRKTISDIHNKDINYALTMYVQATNMLVINLLSLKMCQKAERSLLLTWKYLYMYNENYLPLCVPLQCAFKIPQMYQDQRFNLQLGK